MVVVSNEDVKARADELQAQAERRRTLGAEAKELLLWLGVFTLVIRFLK